jgi:hypothetical protein
MIRFAYKSRHVFWLVAALAIADAAHAQLGLDPAWIRRAATMAPGQSIVRGDSKFTLHARNAGTKDPDGWFLARSTSGGFYIRLPVPMIDATYLYAGRAGFQFTQGLLTAETRTTRYVATCMNPSHVRLPAGIVAQEVRMMQSELRQISSEPFSRGELKGVQYSGVRNPDMHIVGQIFLMDRQVCLLMVGAAGQAPVDAQRAFESFRPAHGDTAEGP